MADTKRSWADAPAVNSADWHSRNGGQEWRYDASGVYLRNQPDTPLRTSGNPDTVAAILKAFGSEIYEASRHYKVPPELIIMTIATETASFGNSGFTGPRTFRWEAHITDYSAGPMQLLSSTARDIINKVPVECEPDDIPPRLSAKPATPPTENPLYDADLSINVGTAYIARNASQHGTGFDPILVASCYNAGSLRASSNNPWGLVTFGNHLDRAAPWFGDACAVLGPLRAAGQEPEEQPGVDFGESGSTFLELSDLTREAAEKERAFYQDAGADVDWQDQSDDLVTLVIEFSTKPAKPPAPTNLALPPPNQDGYVLCINRVRTERRAGRPFDRTIGFYQAFFNNQPISEISGVTVERQGPGDNSQTGVAQHRRIEAGSYPLFTHAGANGKYRTMGFRTPAALGNRPWPSIRVGNTDQRSGILCHCAGGYLMSIGCINLTGTLPDARADINFSDSHARVVALIQSIKKHLGGDFPTLNNTKIPKATLLIRNEP
jgi:hypothetical protein